MVSLKNNPKVQLFWANPNNNWNFDKYSLSSKEVLKEITRKFNALLTVIESGLNPFFEWDEDNQAVKTVYPLYSDEWISSGGVSADGKEEESPLFTIYPYDKLTDSSLELDELSEIDTFNAYTIKTIYNNSITWDKLKESDLNHTNVIHIDHLPIDDIITKVEEALGGSLGSLLYGGTVDPSAQAHLTQDAKAKLELTVDYITLTSYNATQFSGVYFVYTGGTPVVGTIVSSLKARTRDWIISNGIEWDKIDSRDTIDTVAGLEGNDNGDIPKEDLLKALGFELVEVSTLTGTETAMKVNYPFFSDRWISSGGVGPSNEGNATIIDWSHINDTFTDPYDTSVSFNAYTTAKIYEQVKEGTINEDKLWQILSEDPNNKVFKYDYIPIIKNDKIEYPYIKLFGTDSSTASLSLIDDSNNEFHADLSNIELGKSINTSDFQKALDVYKLLQWFKLDNSNPDELAIHTTLPIYSDYWISSGGKDNDGLPVFSTVQQWYTTDEYDTEPAGYGLVRELKASLDALSNVDDDKIITIDNFNTTIDNWIMSTAGDTSLQKWFNKTSSISFLKEYLEKNELGGAGDDCVKYSDDGHVYINKTSTSNVYVAGTIIGRSTQASDKKLKTKIKNISEGEAIDVIMNLRPVRFNWKKSIPKELSFLQGESQGFIAQEYERVIPNSSSHIHKDYKGIDYLRAIPYMVKLLQSQEVRIKELEKIILKLGGEL